MKKTAKIKKKKTQKSKALQPEKLLKDMWPLEHDFFERPDRYRYVRKIFVPQACVFCIAEKKRISFESLCLAKTEHAMVIMNKYPYNTGHLLILPRRHVAHIWDLTEEELFEITKWTQVSMRVLDQVYGCKGMNMGMNHGAVAGAGIPDHIHWHIIPRWFGDTNFFPLIAKTKALPETVKQSYQRLKGAFKEEMNAWKK